MKSNLPNRSSQCSEPHHQGFTLIEMLITMLIIAILSMVAYPGYLNWVRKAHRSDAMASLSQYQTLLERCYAQNFTYNSPCTSFPTFPVASLQGYYTISLTNQTESTYTLTATAIGDQAHDTTCATLSVNQANTKSASDSAANAQTSCWNP